MTADDRPNDRDELGRWIARTVRSALAYAITLVRNRHDAEDVVQECYRKLLARSGQYDLLRDGEKLLYKAVTNGCINLVQRRPGKGGTDVLEDAVLPPYREDGQSPDSRLIQKEREHVVDEVLKNLPVNQRAVLELSSLGHSLVDVAEMVNVSHSNARVLLHRARHCVAERLKAFEQGGRGE